MPCGQLGIVSCWGVVGQRWTGEGLGNGGGEGSLVVGRKAGQAEKWGRVSKNSQLNCNEALERGGAGRGELDSWASQRLWHHKVKLK